MKSYLLAFLATFIVISSCTDDDKSLYQIKGTAGTNTHLPFLTTDQNGNVFLSWVETDTSGHTSFLKYAQFKEDGWSSPKTIARSNDWFVNWADFPSIVAKNGAVTAAHALRKIPGNTYSYNVNIYQPDSAGQWNKPVTPHFDSTATEHGFVSLAPWRDTILAVWLDGRRTANRTEQEYYDIGKAMTLRSAFINPDGSVTESQLIDEAVCDCCNTSLAITAQGPIVAYRNRTDNEIRDIYVSRFIEGEWTAPASVGNDQWHIGACPVNGPAIAAQDSVVVVAWYTGAEKTNQVKAARSTDFGKTFSAPVIMQEAQAVGRVEVVLDKTGTAYIGWITRRQEQTALTVQALHADGSTSAAQAISQMSANRQSGFPQMELQKEHLILAWTNVDSAATSITTTRIPTFK